MDAPPQPDSTRAPAAARTVMRWAAAASGTALGERALDEAVGSIVAQLDRDDPDLVVAFVSPHHRDLLFDLRERLFSSGRLSGAGLLVGCSAVGVIGGGNEIEHRPGLSLTAAVLPGVALHPLRVETLPSVDASVEAWRELVGIPPEERPSFLLLADPFTCDAQILASGLDAAYPGRTKVGGLASGGQPGVQALYLGGEVHHGGAIGVALTGAIEVDAIVAQGCRPIGRPMFVTRCQGPLLEELNGRKALEVVRELHESLSPEDQELFQHSLFFGVVMDEARQEYHLGDFLIRNIAGLDRDSQALVVGVELRVHQVVQFHLRDARTSAAELSALLDDYGRRATGPRPAGSLLFSCVGRGAGLYGVQGHDSRLFRERLGDVPLGGFFCSGEIGPVQGATYLHGYTSSFGLFRPPEG